MTDAAARPDVSHRTLLAVATARGYDCRALSTLPRASAPTLRESDAPPDWHAPDRRAVFDGVDPRRHEALLVVPLAGPVERYCTLPLDLSGFRAGEGGASSRGDDAGDGTRPRALLVEVDSDADATEFRRLWEGARAVAAVVAETAAPAATLPEPATLLEGAVERLTHERAVIRQRRGPRPPP